MLLADLVRTALTEVTINGNNGSAGVAYLWRLPYYDNDATNGEESRDNKGRLILAAALTPTSPRTRPPRLGPDSDVSLRSADWYSVPVLVPRSGDEKGSWYRRVYY
eukprot:1366065-Rhodomonas_salina.1